MHMCNHMCACLNAYHKFMYICMSVYINPAICIYVMLHTYIYVYVLVCISGELEGMVPCVTVCERDLANQATVEMALPTVWRHCVYFGSLMWHVV